MKQFCFRLLSLIGILYTVLIAHTVLCYSLDDIGKVHQWVVAVDEGEDAAIQLAQKLNLTFKQRVGTLDLYLLEGQWPESNRLSAFSRPIKKREAHIKSQSWMSEISEKLKKENGVRFSERQIPKKRVKRAAYTGGISFNDPNWPRSWYMIGGAKGGYDMNVRAAWQAGYTGMNVVVSILDDGIERDHPDIAPNYDPKASKDINNNDDDPTPRYDPGDSNRHGTRCAGQVAAVANNNVCTVGVAFNARIGGVRMLDGGITDAVEAASLSLEPQHIDIYSASWGPDDNGKALDGPGVAAKEAFVQGVLKGRNGKGNIFVWASGNGGNAADSCACDGYANSIFTLSISSASENGVKPWYLEECASTIATTYSSGDPSNDRQIVTTDLHHLCTERHTGTSASAPLAAGMVALALEANPQLTWRDVQHIVVESSRPEPLQDANWIINGVGRKVSTRYGYGLMDGLEMVRLAERWKTVPQQKICSAYLDDKPRDMSGQSHLVLETTVDACSGVSDFVLYLEHVQAQISLDYSRRGDLTIYLTSPSGTRSQLIPQRSQDRDAGEYKEWPFMSVQFWGETASGKWKLEIVNTGSEANHGTFKMWRLVLYGTETAPEASTLARKGVSLTSPSPASLRGVSTANLPTTASGNQNGTSLCHPECADSCTGHSAADCRACKHYRTASGVCVATCLPQFYRDEEKKLCIACSPHCTTCASATQCAACQADMFLSPNRSECVKECPHGFCQDDLKMSCEECPGRCPQGFYEKWIWGCAPCHETCRTCSTSGLTGCLICRNGLSLDTATNKCLSPKSKCAFNEFELYHKCTRCHPLCRTCAGGTEQDCTSCPDAKYFFNGTCIDECPKHHAPFESADPVDKNRIHRQCMYCFDEELSGAESRTCQLHLKIVNGNDLWKSIGSHGATLPIFAATTVILVLLAIYAVIRLRRSLKTRSMGGKRYVQLTPRVVKTASSGVNGRFKSAHYKSYVNVDAFGSSSSGNGGIDDDDEVEVLEFDTVPDLPRNNSNNNNNSNSMRRSPQRGNSPL